MRCVGRYELWTRLAAGGMGAVHLGCVRGEAGFRRAVAIKTMHASIADNPTSVAAFIDEARLAARLRHPNLVSTIDVAAEEGQLVLVMDYVHGESLARLVQLAQRVPPRIAVAITIAALRGLHAAHEILGDEGEPLGLVHRDVSPQNVIVGVDGVARVADFGVAKAAGRINLTSSDGGVKGKLAYMAPEQLSGHELDRRTDVFAIGVVLWELLAGTYLFLAASEAATVTRILHTPIASPSDHDPDVSPLLEAIVMRALSRSIEDRFATAREMADALDATGLAASVSDVGEWVAATAQESLAARANVVSAIERARTSSADLKELAERIAVASALSPGERELETEPMDPSSTTGATTRTKDRWTKIRRSRRAPLLMFMTGFILVAAGAVAFVAWRGSRGANEEPPPIAAAPPPPAPPQPAPEPEPEPAIELPATPETAAPATSGRRRAPKPGASARPSCADPYTRDSLGRKIYKRECLND
ncbi:MAG: serine/threonine protein kinase [Labilithrix sp.]|nr:serine/threonine protein kinase [Labilithrix sp.]MCW5816546.1 serine/threonine protein kinase [Labilithrix sp.]